MDDCTYKDPRCATTEQCWCTGSPIPPIVKPRKQADPFAPAEWAVNYDPPNPWGQPIFTTRAVTDMDEATTQRMQAAYEEMIRARIRTLR